MPPARCSQRVTLLLVVLVAQAIVGYVQYFNDIPAFLVGIHVAGATAVWSATVMLYLGLFDRTLRDACGAQPCRPSPTNSLLAPA